MHTEAEQTADTKSAQRRPGSVPALIHAVCLALASGALLTLFYALRSIVTAHPEHAEGLAGSGQAALGLGLCALVLAGASVSAGLVRPLRRSDWLAGELAQALARHRHRDELTGALNRTAFDQMIVGALEGLKRSGLGFTGIMVEAAGLQQYCEEHGYEAGDRAVAELARLLRANLRKADSLFRWRGGSFLILAPGTSDEQARLLADKLGRLSEERQLAGGGRLPLCLAVAQADSADTPESFSGRVLAALEQTRGHCAGAGAARAQGAG